MRRSQWLTMASIVILVAAYVPMAVLAEGPAVYRLGAGETLVLDGPLTIRAESIFIDGSISSPGGVHDLVLVAAREIVVSGSIDLGQAATPPAGIAPVDAVGARGADGGDLVLRAPIVRILEDARLHAGDASAGADAYAGVLFAPLTQLAVPPVVTATAGHGGVGGSLVVDAAEAAIEGRLAPGAGAPGGQAVATGFAGTAPDAEATAAVATGGNGGRPGDLVVPGDVLALDVDWPSGADGGYGFAYGGPGFSADGPEDYVDLKTLVRGDLAAYGLPAPLVLPDLGFLIRFYQACSNGNTPGENEAHNNLATGNGGDPGGQGSDTGGTTGAVGGDGCKGGTGGAAKGTAGHGSDVAFGVAGNGLQGRGTGGIGGNGGLGGKGGQGTNGSCGLFGDSPGGTGGKGGKGGNGGNGGQGWGIGGHGGNSTWGTGGNGGEGVGTGGLSGSGVKGGKGGNGGANGDPGGRGGDGGNGGDNGNGGLGKAWFGHRGTGGGLFRVDGQDGQTTVVGGGHPATAGLGGDAGTGGPDACTDGNGGPGGSGNVGTASTNFGSNGGTSSGHH